MTDERVPEGWRTARLGDLGVEARPGYSSGAHAATGDLVHLRPFNVSRRGELDLRERKYVPSDAGKHRVARGDVLFNNTNSPALVGKTAYVSSSEEMGYSNHMTRLRSRGDLDGRFLAAQLHSLQMSGYFESICSNHVNQASVSTSRLCEVSIVLPPVDEQRRIVDILEDHLSRLDAAENYRTSARRRQESLGEAVVSTLTAGADVRPLAHLLVEPLQNGRSVPTAEGGFPVLRLTSMRGPALDLLETKIGRWTRTDALPFIVKEGDAFVSRGNGSLPLVARASLASTVDSEVAFPDTMIRLRLNTELVLPSAFLAIWNARVVRNQIERAARTTAGIFKLNQAQLAEINVPLPPMASQRAFTNGIELREAAEENLSRSLDLIHRRSAALRRALLHAAFTGRLTGSASDLDRVEEIAATA